MFLSCGIMLNNFSNLGCIIFHDTSHSMNINKKYWFLTWQFYCLSKLVKYTSRYLQVKNYYEMGSMSKGYFLINIFLLGTFAKNTFFVFMLIIILLQACDNCSPSNIHIYNYYYRLIKLTNLSRSSFTFIVIQLNVAHIK